MENLQCCNEPYDDREPQDAASHALEMLRATIRKYGVVRCISNGQRISGEVFVHNVFWIDSGVLLLRSHDSNSIGNFGRGTIVGLGNIFSATSSGHYLEALEDVRYTACPVMHFKSHLHDSQLALAVAEHLHWQAQAMASYVAVLLKEDAYGKVKFALEQLQRTPDDFRDHVSVVKYVCQHTGVSKAHAHSILRQLRMGGYIGMTSGNLTGIIRSLPPAY